MNNKVVTGARLLLGLMLTVFGLNGFLNFLPMPPPETMPAAVLAFMTAMMNTGYFLYLVKATEVAVGLALLTNRFVPLALVVMAPVSINIVAFHLFLQPAGIAPGAVVALLNLFLGVAYIEKFKPMLEAKNEL